MEASPLEAGATTVQDVDERRSQDDIGAGRHSVVR